MPEQITPESWIGHGLGERESPFVEPTPLPPTDPPAGVDVAAIRAQYTPDPLPAPCPEHGPLALQGVGGSEAIWACTAVPGRGNRLVGRHYWDTRAITRVGDERVIALLAHVAALEEQVAALVDLMCTPSAGRLRIIATWAREGREPYERWDTEAKAHWQVIRTALAAAPAAPGVGGAA